MPLRKLGRITGHRKAMLRNLVTSFLRYGRIETTEARAKAIRSIAEKMITLATTDRTSLAARRQVLSYLVDGKTPIARRHALAKQRRELDTTPDMRVVDRLFGEIADKYSHRDGKGGYTRIMKLGPRRGDAAPMVILELVD